MKKITDLTIVVIAQNEADNLPYLFANLSHFCPNILLINNLSTDQTVELALQNNAVVLDTDSDNFADIRNLALKAVKTEWMFYLDADERITPDLAQEIAEFIEQNSGLLNSTEQVAGQFLRQNYFYGHPIKASGYQQDYVTRLFRTDKLLGWEGEVHESAVFQGTAYLFSSPLLHLTHRSTSANLAKSASWTPIEAKLLVQNDPQLKPVTRLTILRKGLGEFNRRYFQQKGYRDQMTGFIECFVQALNRMMVYIQVWELQQKPNLPRRYEQLEKKLAQQW